MLSSPEIWKEFFETYYRNELNKLAYRIAEKSLNSSNSLYVDYSKDLAIFKGGKLAEELLEYPSEVIKHAEEGLAISENIYDVNLSGCRVRFYNLPQTRRIRIKDIRSQHISKFVAIEGIVRKVTEVRPRIVEAIFKCNNCGRLTVVKPQNYTLESPAYCEFCKKKKFSLLLDESKSVDYQRIRIQEYPENLKGGEQPQMLDVILEEDLTGKINPGDRVIVNGILRKISRGSKKSTNLDIILEGNSIEILEQEYEEFEITEEDRKKILELSEDPDIYKKITESIAPSIYGYEDIKLAIALQLFGGIPKKLPDGTEIRGDIHILLVGDPGVAKCVDPETVVLMADGSLKKIEDLVEKEISVNANKIDDGFYARTNHDIIALNSSTAKNIVCKADIVWKRLAPERMYRIYTKTGKILGVTPTHPFFTLEDGEIKIKRAKDLQVGDPIATPSVIPVFGKPQPLPNVGLPINTTSEEFWKFFGVVLFKGKIIKKRLIVDKPSDDFVKFIEKLGVDYRKAKNKIIIHDKRLIDLVTCLGTNKVPDLLFKCSKDEIKTFLKIALNLKGKVKKGKIIIEGSKTILKQLQHLLLRFGVISKVGSYLTILTSSKLVNEFDLNLNVKDSKIGIPNISKIIEELKLILNLNDSDIPKSTFYCYEKGLREIPKDTLNKIIANFERKLILLKSYLSKEITSWKDIREIRKDLGISQSKLANKIGKSQKSVSLYETTGAVNSELEKAKKFLIEEIKDRLNVAERKISILKIIANSDIFWDKVKKIEIYEPRFKWVYDLQVPIHHNFIANDIYVHNSQLLKYVHRIAPRSVYTTGRGTTYAGLTATATRDEYDGRWTLEAGALVLADKGVALVDEIDKMRSEDRSALHEVMEQQTVSVAKAGINAILKARCSILAAANPKYGRFDRYTPIAEQIDLPPTLLSRFDLIFVMTDEPNEERDKKLAEHILMTHEIGEKLEKARQLLFSEPTKDIEKIKPKIDPELLRKYIAYAKRVVFPVLTPEAKDKIIQFYLSLRSKAKENSPVPATARQLEALIRLAEASARVRLSDYITAEDVERVIKIVRKCLEEIAIDPETGEIDIDYAFTGTSKTQRDRIVILRKIIEELENSYDKGAPEDEILKRAEEHKIDREKAREILYKMRERGDLYCPRPGFFRIVRRD